MLASSRSAPGIACHLIAFENSFFFNEHLTAALLPAWFGICWMLCGSEIVEKEFLYQSQKVMTGA